ncbi:STAS domain-containing protein [Tepidimicrobium xylanilyticum]|uniref:Anti-sigma factor antagonist n=1 Tax=Tepidimicrobium xylanilyticum TaxID=1123352 RepID=A0A1H3AI40_9FIRM|nr:STAS domain-containing protein [Tepidimicrobium xylanilyticum]GMG98138.1 anti-sigma factor antagonist [Tepidimicrobium xylanilyticum]SDX29008.1 anti-sigma B factor antagonist [Tepidimicrobium xylanilyticum]
MSLDVNIGFNEERDIWVVLPEGEIDIYTSPKFKSKLMEALDDRKSDILIDGKKLDYLDSTGLGTLISILKKAKESDNKVYLKNIKPNIRKLFDITELDKIFEFEE